MRSNEFDFGSAEFEAHVEGSHVLSSQLVLYIKLELYTFKVFKSCVEWHSKDGLWGQSILREGIQRGIICRIKNKNKIN